MATITEFGTRYPCRSQGTEIPVDDTEIYLYPGDIFEARLVSDGDITPLAASQAVAEIIKIKNNYPNCVIHYVKVETRTITVQYSSAPVGHPPNLPLCWHIAFAIIAVLGAILIVYLLTIAADRGWILPHKPPMGDAQAWAKDMKYNIPLANVKITGGGKTLTTGPNGEAVFFEDLTAGNYTFVAETKEGYHPPLAQTVTIVAGGVAEVMFRYYHLDQVPPTTGFLVVDSEPIKGGVSIGGVSYAQTPVGPFELDAGSTVAIVFSHVDGWVTPPHQVATIPQGDTITIVGTYKEPGSEDEGWWEKYARYALIGGGVILGTAIILPEVVRQISRRGGEK